MKKIIQIIPADNWWVDYKNDDQNQTLSTSKILCLALVEYEDGFRDIVFMDADRHGIIGEACHSSNVHRIFYRK